MLPTGTDEPIDFLAPAVLALAVMSTAMVSLGIGTGFERMYGVLKRLGGLAARPRAGGCGAKIATVLVTEVVQWAVLIAVVAAARLVAARVGMGGRDGREHCSAPRPSADSGC